MILFHIEPGVSLQEPQDVRPAILGNVAGAPTISGHVSLLQRVELFAHLRAVRAVRALWSQPETIEESHLVVAEDEAHMGLLQEVHHASGIRAAMEQVPHGEQIVPGIQRDLLQKLGQLAGAAVNVTNDPSRHRLRLPIRRPKDPAERMIADSKNPYSVRALLASFESERCNNGATVQKTDPCLGFPSGRR